MTLKHKEIITETIDRLTGEVVKDKKVQTFKAYTEPKFVKMYVEDISRMMSLNSTASRLLLCLATRIGYDSVITLSPFVKRQIANDMGVKSTQTIDNNISTLISHGAMKRQGRGSFMLNPDYFAMGKWQDVAKLKNAYIKMTVTYAGGRKATKTEIGTGIITNDGDNYIITEDGEKIAL